MRGCHLLLGVLCAAGVPNRAVAQVTDTTIGVSAGTRLRLDVNAGKVDVRVWDRDAIHVHATHDAASELRVAAAPGLVSVSVARRRGVAECECVVTIPRSMAVTVGGGDTEIGIAGTGAEVVARNYSGRIVISGGRGKVSAESTLGEVIISDVRGRVTASSLHAPIRVTDVEGDVEAEGSSSHVYLTGIVSRSVTASTVGGGITFAGRLFDDGHYTFSTHMGSIFLTVPEPVSARVTVSTVSGGFASAIAHTRQEGSRRGRFGAVFGAGTATVEAQTFSGGIVVRAAEAGSKPE